MNSIQSNNLLQKIATEKSIKRILVPIDFSEASHNAFEYAMHIAEMLDASLSVLHVYQGLHADISYIPAQLVSALLEEKLEKANSLLRDYLSEAKTNLGKSVKVSSHLRSGKAPSEIVRFAEEQDADLIIIGTQGTNSPSEQILGSIAARVIQRSSSCPVLAIPSKAKFSPIYKIMYALNFEEDDAENVEKLIVFSKALKGNLICTNIKSKHSEWNPNKDLLLNELKKWEDAGNLSIAIKETQNVIGGLRDFIYQNSIDIIAMKTHKESAGLLELSQSLTRKMLMEVQVPILAFQSEA